MPGHAKAKLVKLLKPTGARGAEKGIGQAQGPEQGSRRYGKAETTALQAESVASMAAIAADKAARELANKEWLEGLTRQRDELLGGVDSPGRAYLMDGHTPGNDAEED